MTNPRTTNLSGIHSRFESGAGHYTLALRRPAVTDESRLELLTHLRTARRARMARRGELGPVIKALHDLADLMDAEGLLWARTDWKRGIRHRPSPCTVSTVSHLAFRASYGVTSRADWDAKEDRMRRISHQARMEWWRQCRPVYRQVIELIAPNGLHSPNLTAADVRAVADRIAADGDPQ